MRLTSLLIDHAPTVINPQGQYTIQLRNLKIPYIENLGILQDKFDVIDLTGNELVELAGLPPASHKLRVLLLANNNITTISDIQDLPNLSTIALTNNKVASFRDILGLAHLPSLTNLSLVGNPVSGLEHYRIFVIWLLPSLTVLDFQKVKQAERQQGSEKFGASLSGATALAQSLLGAGPGPKKLSDDDRIRLIQKLETADSIDEIEAIELALKTGH